MTLDEGDQPGRWPEDGTPADLPVSPARRFPLIPFDAITLSSAPRYLIKGLIPGHGLVVAWGPPKCGKSFVVFDMTMHVALGRDYRGRRVRQGTVVYCALEGQQGFEARAAAYRLHHLESFEGAVPFHLMPSPLSLSKDHADLISSIRQQLGEQSPAVVVLDTLNRSFSGSESDDEAMTAYVKAADAVRDAFGCVVIVVHHCGIEGTRPRGHSALGGAVDAQLAVKKSGQGTITVTTELVKDGPEGETLASRLERVEVGTDDEGDPIASCVVLEADAPPATGSRRNEVPARCRLALDALREALGEHGRPLPPAFGLPKDMRGVDRRAWLEEIFRRGILDRDGGNPREQFRRIKVDLMGRGHVAERNDLVWLV